MKRSSCTHTQHLHNSYSCMCCVFILCVYYWLFNLSSCMCLLSASYVFKMFYMLEIGCIVLTFPSLAFGWGRRCVWVVRWSQALVTSARSQAQIAQWSSRFLALVMRWSTSATPHQRNSSRELALVWRLCGALVTSACAIFALCAGSALVTSASWPAQEVHTWCIL